MNSKKQHIIFTCITCFVVLLSCTQKITDPNIILFQQELGEENIAMIDLLVEEFEDHLESHYPKLNTKEAYTQFLKDISDQDTSNDSLLITYQSKASRENYRKSALYKDIYIKEPYHQKIEGLVELNQPPPDKNNPINEPDSIWRVNNIGKYMRALFAIEGDSLVQTYFRSRESSGLMSTNRFAKGIQYYKPDFDNYIHKRIVVIENSL
ncbi:hypothetical protein [Dokdonia pacifica]|uniref:Uncharacterized protein n=1 Tax=Dokdonia pacifica TaxID=1627892 RepID=A0A239CX38_9FLAO|nr:hypothetical protein [Dokdonia pacifica]SNS24670.1 hypothetical protein SAMN06265376_10925 [Dokdonia pacifica]